jgi:hypothetical protein
MNRADLKADYRVHAAPRDLEDCFPGNWWKTLFNENYLKTDGDVVEKYLGDWTRRKCR